MACRETRRIPFPSLYHQSRALYEAMRWDPFLQTLRANMDLDAPAREHLYNYRINTAVRRTI